MAIFNRISAGLLNASQAVPRFVTQQHPHRIDGHQEAYNQIHDAPNFLQKLTKASTPPHLISLPAYNHFYHHKGVISGNGLFQNAYAKSDICKRQLQSQLGLQRPSAAIGLGVCVGG